MIRTDGQTLLSSTDARFTDLSAGQPVPTYSVTFTSANWFTEAHIIVSANPQFNGPATRS